MMHKASITYSDIDLVVVETHPTGMCNAACLIRKNISDELRLLKTSSYQVASCWFMYPHAKVVFVCFHSLHTTHI